MATRKRNSTSIFPFPMLTAKAAKKVIIGQKYKLISFAKLCQAELIEGKLKIPFNLCAKLATNGIQQSFVCSSNSEK